MVVEEFVLGNNVVTVSFVKIEKVGVEAKKRPQRFRKNHGLCDSFVSDSMYKSD